MNIFCSLSCQEGLTDSFCEMPHHQILAERTPVASRQSVKENEYMCHCYVRPDGLVGVCVSDEEYQTRVAHSLITKILDEFAGQGGIRVRKCSVGRPLSRDMLYREGRQVSDWVGLT